MRLLVLSGLEGTLEPCGCNERVLGGWSRIAPLLLAESASTPTLFVVGGNTFFEPATEASTQTRWRAEYLADLLHRAEVDLVVPGPADLAFGGKGLAELKRRARARFIGAGAKARGSPAPSEARHASARVDGQLSDRETLEVLPTGAHITLGDVDVVIGGAEMTGDASGPERLARMTDYLEGAPPQALRVAWISGSTRAAASLPADLVIASNLPPPAEQPAGGPKIVTPPSRGRSLVVVDAERPTEGAWELSARFVDITRDLPADPRVDKELRALDERIARFNRQAFEDEAPVPISPDGVGFVGSRPCAACHTAAYVWWVRSSHGTAYATLRERGRNYDLTCVGCHVTGYREPGGATLTHPEGREGVGCESCHGPGSLHVQNPQPPHQVIRRKVSVEVCTACHDSVHSRAYDDEAYRRTLEVPGHGRSVAGPMP